MKVKTVLSPSPSILLPFRDGASVVVVILIVNVRPLPACLGRFVHFI